MMDYQASFQISASGMAVEKLRLDVTAANLANMHTTAASAGALYRPMRVIARENPLNVVQTFGEMYQTAGGGAQVVAIEHLDVSPRMVYEPGHPDADQSGFVSYPGISNTTEMINMMNALRAYESNVVAMNAAKTMAAKTLEIGGQA